MIQDVDLNDLKNQYLDNISKPHNEKDSLIDSYHILYHICILKQETQGALLYAFELA